MKQINAFVLFVIDHTERYFEREKLVKKEEKCTGLCVSVKRKQMKRKWSEYSLEWVKKEKKTTTEKDTVTWNFAHNLSALLFAAVKNWRRNACVLGQQAQTHVDGSSAEQREQWREWVSYGMFGSRFIDWSPAADHCNYTYVRLFSHWKKKFTCNETLWQILNDSQCRIYNKDRTFLQNCTQLKWVFEKTHTALL